MKGGYIEYQMAVASQTLSRLAKPLLNLRGIEKNLLARESIKSIIYSPNFIELNLFSFPRQKQKTGAESAGKMFRNEYMAPYSDLYRLFSPMRFITARNVIFNDSAGVHPLTSKMSRASLRPLPRKNLSNS